MPLPSCECVAEKPPLERLSDIYCALHTLVQGTGDLTVINVTDAEFGAVGDGVTDDSASIALAVARMNETGGILYFPPGEYLDSSTHTLTGPLIEHPLEEAPYRGNFIVAGAGTASIWKYTGGAGTFLTISGSDGPPSNVVFRDMQIKGTSTGADSWALAVVGIDVIESSVDFQFDNVQISNFQIGLRCFDLTSCGIRQCYFRHCQIGLAGDYKFDGVVLDRIGAQNCDVGIDLGYYNSARTYVTAPPPVEGVSIVGGIFGSNRIAVIAGGAGSSGINITGCYFEAQTEANIDVGHNTVDYSGNAQEGAANVGQIYIRGCYFQTTVAVCRVWASAILDFGFNGYNGPSVPFVDLQNANSDTSTIRIHDAVANILQYSGGTNVTGPLQTTNQRFRTFATVDSAEIAPLVLNSPAGGFPGMQLQLAAAVKGYFVCAGTAAAFFTDAQVGDLIFRSEANRVLFGVGSGASSLQVTGAQVASAVPVKLPSYTVATLPAQNTGAMIYVSNETGGAVPAFSDGTNWRRVTDRAIVS